MISNLWGLFAHPDQQWQEIRRQENSIANTYLTYVLFLAAIPAISAFIGTTQVGWAFAGRSPTLLTVESAIPLSILSYIAMLAGVFVMGLFTHWMSRTYSSNPTLAQCISFSAFTATPLFIGGIAALYPHLWFAMAVGTAAICYTVYLLYVGLPTFMGIPEDEGFLFSSSILAVGLVVLVAMMAATVILWGSGVGPVYIR